MFVNFHEVEEAILKNIHNGEKEVALRKVKLDKFSIMWGKLVPGASIGMHKHSDNCEILYIIKGTGKVIFDGEENSIGEGMCNYCPQGHQHTLINDSQDDLTFFAVVPD